MIYLESIVLLDYALKKLNAGKRDQVAVSTLTEIQQVVKVATTKLGENPGLVYKMALEDLLEALSTAQSLSGMLSITDKMKQTVVDGVMTLKTEVCRLAFKYYSTHEFEVTESVIPTMREVVKVQFLGG